MDNPGFIEQMKMAGAAAYLMIFLMVILLGTGGAGFILALVKQPAARILGFVTLGGAALILVVGFAGKQMGLRGTERALVGVEPDMRERILEAGTHEASYNVSLAGEFAVLPALLGVLAATLGGKKPDAAKAG
ncbi:MAG: hypothetical protein JST54_01375 [Deltaproteobacteria bacterium]|nr:hypothetical protein [Deltaproteobacteria bacterium]